jgi:uncharacterized membrane protein
MGTGQVRYWSMCANLPDTSVIECIQDEDVPVDKDGYFTMVVSRPVDRPENAKKECGTAWLPASENGNTVLVYRHMIPDDSFGEAIQKSQKDAEAQTMGEYYPRGIYFKSAADFERLACRPGEVMK